MHKVEHALLKETVFTETLPNGLKVFLVPKPGFTKTYAVFATRYGSMDNHFKVGGSEHRVTDGIAHFLEHKLFEEEFGDIFHAFAEQGASANAYTSHHHTAYLFSATDLIPKNLTTLLDFVQRPYLTPENVEKEKGIIEQEIRMYDDMPYWRGYRQLLESMFHVSPVKIDIAGTVESIHRIDVDALMRCYTTFYHPSNMILVVVGDVNPEALMALVRENQAAKTFAPQPPIERLFAPEPGSVAQPRATLALSVSRPTVMIGFKDPQGTPAETRLRRQLLMNVVQNALFGRTSDLYQALLDDGTIDDSLAFDYDTGAHYGYSYLAVETDAPERFEAAIAEAVARAHAHGLDPEAFSRSVNKQLGDFLHGLNSPEAIANALADTTFQGGDYFAIPELLEALTLEEANALVREHFSPSQQAVTIVTPAAGALPVAV